MSGKRGVAPCGHDGEHIVGNYVRCDRGCDRVSKPVIAPRCPQITCRSLDVDPDFDLGAMYLAFHPFATVVNTRCRTCGHCWVRVE